LWGSGEGNSDPKGGREKVAPMLKKAQHLQCHLESLSSVATSFTRQIIQQACNVASGSGVMSKQGENSMASVTEEHPWKRM
jgi:hypothetical protein